jgi:pimeloyl-ACP methyl ester carboxylesterase
MTANDALVAFLTPSKGPELSREIALRAAARSSRIQLGVSGFARGGGDQIQAYSWGEGPSILLVHGWEGRATNFAAFIPALTVAGFRAVSFDAPGHGQSSGILSSAPAIAAGIQAVEQRTGPFYAIIAHSLGALASTCALSRGSYADRVIFLAACCWVKPLLTKFVERLGLPDDKRLELFSFSAGEFRPEEISAEAVAPSLGGISALLMHDPADPEMPYEHSTAVANAWPGAVLFPVPGVGHRRILRSRAAIDRALAHLKTDPPGRLP